MATKGRPSRATEGVKALITAAALTATVAGWAALADRPADPVEPATPAPVLSAPVPAVSAPTPVINRPIPARPAPITTTRSSR